LCWDLHFMRCALRYVATDKCPFCECDPQQRVFSTIDFERHIYDSDHMLCNIISSFLTSTWRNIPEDLQYWFVQRVQQMDGFKKWAPGSDFGLRWRDCKVFVGWTHALRTNVRACGFLRLVAECVSRFEYPVDRRPKFRNLASRVVDILHLLSTKQYCHADRGRFVGNVRGLCELWECVFLDKAPVSVHICEYHWPDWLRLVIAYYVRTEGGEATNGPHGDKFRDATTVFLAVGKQIRAAGQVLRDGCDTLLELFIGTWYIIKERMCGGWPNWL